MSWKQKKQSNPSYVCTTHTEGKNLNRCMHIKQLQRVDLKGGQMIAMFCVYFLYICYFLFESVEKTDFVTKHFRVCVKRVTYHQLSEVKFVVWC